MKTILLALAFLVLVTGCGGLKLALDTTAPDGSRVYATSDVTLFTDEGDDICTALAIKAGGTDTLYGISISCGKKSEKALFRKGGRLTVSFEDGSRIELRNIMNSYMEVENNFVLKSTPVHGVVYDYYYSPWAGLMYGAPYQVAGYVPAPSIEKHTASYALYLLSGDQVRAIAGKAVSGFEIEASDRKFAMPNPSDAGDIYSQLHAYLLEKRK